MCSMANDYLFVMENGDQIISEPEQSSIYDSIMWKNKEDILSTIWNDTYFQVMMNDGFVAQLMIDKDSIMVSELEEDRKYFVICETTIPVTYTNLIRNLPHILYDVVRKHFVAPFGIIIDDETSETFRISIAITYPAK